MLWSIWYGTYLLGRRPEPQPLALPFGGEPTVRDYGRMIADAALLLIVATVGIVWRMHETSEVPALIAFQALAYYSVARSEEHTSELQSLMRISYAVFCLKKKKTQQTDNTKVKTTKSYL